MHFPYQQLWKTVSYSIKLIHFSISIFSCQGLHSSFFYHFIIFSTYFMLLLEPKPFFIQPLLFITPLVVVAELLDFNCSVKMMECYFIIILLIINFQLIKLFLLIFLVFSLISFSHFSFLFLNFCLFVNSLKISC